MRADISSIIQIQSRRIKGKQLTIGRRGIKRTCNCVRCPTVSSMPWCKGKYITSGCGALCPLSRLKSKRQKKKKEKKKENEVKWNFFVPESNLHSEKGPYHSSASLFYSSVSSSSSSSMYSIWSGSAASWPNKTLYFYFNRREEPSSLGLSLIKGSRRRRRRRMLFVYNG